MSGLSVSHLSLFLRIAENLSISETARELGTTQPAISRILAGLEEHYGAQLFMRAGRLQLTTEGRLLVRRAQKALTELESAEAEIESLRRMSVGMLAVGSSHMLTHYYLLPALRQFHEENPHVSIRMENVGILETVRCLLDERIELGVVTTPYGSTGGIEFLPFSTMTDCFLAGESFLELKNHPVSVKELASYPLIVMKSGRISREFQEHFFEIRHAELKPEMECAMMSLTADFVAAGLGIGWVCDRVADEAIQAGQPVFKIQLDRPPAPRLVGLIKRSGAPLSSAARAFVSCLGVKSLNTSC